MNLNYKIHNKKSPRFLFAISIVVLLFSVSSAAAAQVTLAWDANDPTPDGYQVLQRIEGEQYDYANPVWPTDGNDHTETTCTITNLIPGAIYYFVVRAYADNDESGDSNEISYTVPVEVTLSSITINGPTQLDENDNAQYTATANYSDGSSSTLSSGITWSENSAATSITSSGVLTTANVTSDTSVTITASYGGHTDTHTVTVQNVPHTLSSITISGPIQVDENSSAQYTCTANYSDGSSSTISSGITWNENSAATSITSNGLLTAGRIDSDRSVTITAAYEGISDTHSVTVKDVAVKNESVTLSSLTISGPAQLNEGGTAQYTCTANYSDNTTANITDSVHWSVNSDDANINAAGQLVAGAVRSDELVTITASIDGQQANHNLTINNSSNEQFTLTVDILGSGSVQFDPPGDTYEAGTVVTLTAEADHAYAFDGWIGSVADTESNITTVIVDADISLSATFLEDTDLDSVPDSEEWGDDSQDTNFDGNSDGIADYLQSNVASIHTNDYQ
ncbi:MAG: fibronectin type III domain-containing protein, partial [Desulfobacteraceae bacterium]